MRALIVVHACAQITELNDFPSAQRLGSVRGEDLPYVFGLPLVAGQPHFAQNFSRQDMGVAEAVLNFVTNFCKTGDPNEAGHQQVNDNDDDNFDDDASETDEHKFTTTAPLCVSSCPPLRVCVRYVRRGRHVPVHTRMQAMLHPDYGTTRERTRYRGITWEPYETTTQQYLSICKWQSF